MTALLAMLLGAALFSDHVDCTVQGYVYRMSEQDDAEFQRADSCIGVRYSLAGDSLVMYSPKVWVKVIIPAEHGHRIFQYHWTSEFAHIGPDTVRIRWGWTGKG